MPDYVKVTLQDQNLVFDVTGQLPGGTLMIELTSRCNLRCVFCPKSEPGNDVLPGRDEDMSEALTERLLQFAREAEPNELLLSGTGETTFRDNWVEVTRKFQSLGARISTLNSNFARPFSTEELEHLLDFTRIVVSIDSLDAVLLKRLRRSVDLRNITTNVVALRARARLLGRPIPKMFVNCTVTTANVTGLADLAAYCAELSFDGLSFSSLYDTGYEHNVGQVESVDKLDPTKRALLQEELERARRVVAGSSLNLQIQPQLYNVAVAEKDAVVTPGNTRLCLQPWSRYTIAADGQVYPCCVTIEPVGELTGQSAGEVLDGERIRAFRRQLLTDNPPEVCLKCSNAPVGTPHELLHAVLTSKLHAGQVLKLLPTSA